MKARVYTVAEAEVACRIAEVLAPIARIINSHEDVALENAKRIIRAWTEEVMDSHERGETP